MKSKNLRIKSLNDRLLLDYNGDKSSISSSLKLSFFSFFQTQWSNHEFNEIAYILFRTKISKLFGSLVSF